VDHADDDSFAIGWIDRDHHFEVGCRLGSHEQQRPRHPCKYTSHSAPVALFALTVVNSLGDERIRSNGVRTAATDNKCLSNAQDSQALCGPLTLLRLTSCPSLPPTLSMTLWLQRPALLSLARPHRAATPRACPTP